MFISYGLLYESDYSPGRSIQAHVFLSVFLVGLVRGKVLEFFWKNDQIPFALGDSLFYVFDFLPIFFESEEYGPVKNYALLIDFFLFVQYEIDIDSGQL